MLETGSITLLFPGNVSKTFYSYKISEQSNLENSKTAVDNGTVLPSLGYDAMEQVIVDVPLANGGSF